MIASLLLLGPLTLTAPVPATPAATSQEAELPDLKDTVDRSIRWLRGTQDLESGLYGGNLDATSEVLYALAVSPRAYRRVDGPFVARALDALLAHQAEDGSIAAKGAGAPERLTSTRLAAMALAQHPESEQQRALSGALRFLAQHGVDDPASGQALTNDKQQATREALKLVSAADARGTWDGEQGRVRATAEAVVELSHYAKVLSPPKTARDARALPAFTAADQEAKNEAILRGARFLIEQSDDGLWGAPGKPDAGITSMVIGALCSVPEPRPEDVQKVIDNGLEWILGHQNEDGSIHDGKLANYNTSAAILALVRGGNPEHRDAIVRARDFLVLLQADEGEGYSPDHHSYGGIGYGGDERPDLSNLQMALEALSASGLESDHEAFQRARTFLERCQNRSETNDVSLAEGDVIYVSGDDGGGTYMPGNSKAGAIDLGNGKKVARSYGSMSYALLKGYVFSGLDRDDPRVAALWEWLQENYTLDVNPGFEYASDPAAAYQGLFYYFHTMAKALDLFGVEIIVDGAGVEHAWRGELSGRVIAMQSKIDGSWVNENAPRWWEGNPVLATSYALLTLDEASPR